MVQRCHTDLRVREGGVGAGFEEGEGQGVFAAENAAGEEGFVDGTCVVGQDAHVGVELGEGEEEGDEGFWREVGGDYEEELGGEGEEGNPEGKAALL